MSKSVEDSNLTDDYQQSFFSDIEEIDDIPVSVVVDLYFTGELAVDVLFLIIFNGTVIQECKCVDGLDIEALDLNVDLRNSLHKEMLLNSPVFVLIRKHSKSGKDADQLVHPDNIAGGNFDLSPLLFEQSAVLEKQQLVDVTGELTPWHVFIRATHTRIKPELDNTEETLIALTLISAHCLPLPKEGTVHVAAVGLDGLILQEYSKHMGMSLSSKSAKKLVWADACTGGFLSCTSFSVPDDDVFIPTDVEVNTTEDCISVYWNSIKRVIVRSGGLEARLSRPLFIEVGGIPRTGKPELRSHYIASIDARALLEPAQTGLTVTAKLKMFSATLLPEDFEPLLQLPTSAGGKSAKDADISDLVLDEAGHEAYIVFRIDLLDPIVPLEDACSLYTLLDFPLPTQLTPTKDDLYIDPPPDNPFYDARRIKKESGALAVHKELSVLAGNCVVQMSQSIKRNAANRLLIQVKTMLKQFFPGFCSNLEWQETVTGQHATSRRAVTASFAPIPPPLRVVPQSATVRARMAGDESLMKKHIARNLEVSPNHPRMLLPSILVLLENRYDREASKVVAKALKAQVTNRFLLWLYGAVNFSNFDDRKKCVAAFRISSKGDRSDGVANSITWAALHTMHHIMNNQYAAFIAAKKMRIYFSICYDFKSMLERWTDASGQEEVFWNPHALTCADPFINAAAFFLCLRCYDLSESLLKCFDEGCFVRGDRLERKNKDCVDAYYLRAASWFLRGQPKESLDFCYKGISLFGPNRLLSQMILICKSHLERWNPACEVHFLEAEKEGAEGLPKSLMQSALWLMKKNPMEALQRAARAHKAAPGAHSALVIGRVYDRLKEPELAEQWVECAVNLEPLLADGWAFMAYLAMREQDVKRARVMMRTARQAGPISQDIQDMINKMNKLIPIDDLPEMITKNLCICRNTSSPVDMPSR